MSHITPILLLCLASTPESIQTKFEQVHPLPKKASIIEPTPGVTRAILLVPGLHLHPLSKTQAERAEFHSWQKPGSTLVKALAPNADVFSFSYSQNAPLDKISQTPGLSQAVNKLRFLGYEEIILVGHSAGGILARLYVEDHPKTPVTRVVQVCSPNLGSSWANAEISVRKVQESFLHSLTKPERRACCEKRAALAIPAKVEFVCVVGGSSTLGDGIVSTVSQWPADLQKQGIPAVQLSTTHFTVMRSRTTADKIAELARKNHPRWSQEEVRLQRKRIVGE